MAVEIGRVRAVRDEGRLFERRSLCLACLSARAARKDTKTRFHLFAFRFAAVTVACSRHHCNLIFIHVKSFILFIYLFIARGKRTEPPIIFALSLPPNSSCCCCLFSDLLVLSRLRGHVLVNDATQECAEFPMWGDECSLCWIRSGWKSIGQSYFSDDVECPDGYATISGEAAKAIHCYHSRDRESCCNDGCSGIGDCQFLIFNEEGQKCSMSLCSPLPDGWSRDLPAGSYGRCPDEYEWVEEEDIECDNPCDALFSCGECVSTGCMWSTSEQSCNTMCRGTSCLSATL